MPSEDNEKVVRLFKSEEVDDAIDPDNLAKELSILMRKYNVSGYTANYIIGKAAYVSIETLGDNQWSTAGHLIASCQTIIQRLADTK